MASPGSDQVVETRKCRACRAVKSASDFRQRSGKNAHLRRRVCRSCESSASASWKRANPEKARSYKQKPEYREKERQRSRIAQREMGPSEKRRQRGYDLKRYGLTADAYDEMYAAQGGRCCICSESKPQYTCTSRAPNRDVLVVDHDHATGAVRGLLCSRCNIALGQFGDSAEMLRRALFYLGE